MNRIVFQMAVVVLCGFAQLAPSQVTQYRPQGQQIPVPDCLTIGDLWLHGRISCTKEDHRAWLADIRHWRDERRIRIAYDGSRYDLPALKWAQSSYIQPQMMTHDRYFYDPVASRYTVDRYLDDTEKGYGGIDSVLIWPTYPNIGIDDRNQLDMIRSMPGGLDGVRQMVKDFHRRGVRVLFMMMLDDNGTRSPDRPWPEAIAEVMKSIDADGVNGDQEEGVPLGFSLAAEKLGHPLAFQPEVTPSDEAVAWNVMRWGGYRNSFAPQVDRFKWLEPRHMVNVSNRWNREKTNDLQFAFFNGVGWESWENIWGIWNGVTPRDGEATRRVATMERALAPYLVSKDWEPLSPVLQYGVFASRWPLGTRTAWTIINRNEYDVSGFQVEVAAEPGMRYFDLYHGAELTPKRTEDGKLALSFDLEAHGYGALLSSPDGLDSAIQMLMSKMKDMTNQPLASYSNEWKFLPQQIVPFATVKPPKVPPSNMVKIPEGEFNFRVEGVELEGWDNIGVDVQYPWEDSPRRFHNHQMHINSFWIDTYPVTNAEFKRFMDATHYRPQDSSNFLRDWKEGTYPEGWANKPVTWVSLDDARAYAAWAGKRLPHEWEWQYAAQGSDGRTYPWGNEWIASSVPVPDKNRTMQPPDEVDAHPAGASPFGVMDLVGNVWQWTEEFVDAHTRGAVLRGGNHYQPQTCAWYFPQAYKLTEHGKYLLMAPGMDRSGGIGFRTAMDAEN